MNKRLKKKLVKKSESITPSIPKGYGRIISNGDSPYSGTTIYHHFKIGEIVKVHGHWNGFNAYIDCVNEEGILQTVSSDQIELG